MDKHDKQRNACLSGSIQSIMNPGHIYDTIIDLIVKLVFIDWICPKFMD